MRLRLPLVVAGAFLLGAAPAWAWEDYEQGPNAPIITVPAAPPSPVRLPILGVMADVGIPDGLIGSLTVRPWSWVRVAGGGGSNGISSGWRTGITLLPFGAGPSASFEYGQYQEGNANPLAKKIIGGSFDGSPLLQRVGCDYMNLHLGLDFGSRRFVFFLHGGMSILRGHIHNVDAAIRGATAHDTSVAGTTEVTVRQDPSVKEHSRNKRHFAFTESKLPKSPIADLTLTTHTYAGELSPIPELTRLRSGPRSSWPRAKRPT